MLASFPLQASFFVTADLASASVSIFEDVTALAGVLNTTLAVVGVPSLPSYGLAVACVPVLLAACYCTVMQIRFMFSKK